MFCAACAVPGHGLPVRSRPIRPSPSLRQPIVTGVDCWSVGMLEGQDEWKSRGDVQRHHHGYERIDREDRRANAGDRQSPWTTLRSQDPPVSRVAPGVDSTRSRQCRSYGRAFPDSVRGYIWGLSFSSQEYRIYDPSTTLEVRHSRR